jgi:hypothetical protein
VLPPGLRRHQQPEPGGLSQLSDGAAHGTYTFAMTPRPVTDGTAQAQGQRASAEASTYLRTEIQK